MVEVERFPATSPSQLLARFERTQQPLIVEGGAAGQRAVSHWSPEYLKRKVGHVEVDHKRSTSHQHPNFHAPSLRETFGRERSSLSSFIDAVTNGPVDQRATRLFTGDERFLMQRRDGRTKRDEELSVLLEDLDLSDFVPGDRLYTVWGWLSGRGVRTWLHYDNNGCHNLNAQLTGEKQCVLYPPSELGKLRPFLLGGPNPAHNCSELDVEASDLPDDFRSAKSLSATLHAGDLLFIPAWWFHTFLHLGELNSNVNFWWKPEVPGLNPVAARQAMLDAAASSGIDPKDPAAAALLRQLDEALVMHDSRR